MTQSSRLKGENAKLPLCPGQRAAAEICDPEANPGFPIFECHITSGYQISPSMIEKRVAIVIVAWFSLTGRSGNLRASDNHYSWTYSDQP
jgi:hypothetical protein